jgi:dihydroorotate dehydrogenase
MLITFPSENPMGLTFYTSVLRPVLFRMDPEMAHSIASWYLGHRTISRSLYKSFESDNLEINIGGLHFKNPVGLAAGFDKDCEITETESRLGFGHVTVGSILGSPRQGNPRPRVFRHAKIESIVQSLGLPSKGLEYSLERLKTIRDKGCPIFASIADFTIEDYLRSFQAIQPFVDGIEVGLFCPNSSGQEKFREPDQFSELMKKVSRLKKKPIFVKIPTEIPNENHAMLDEIVTLSGKMGVDVLVVSGAQRSPEPRLAKKVGSLSGKVLLYNTLRRVNKIYRLTEGKIPIKANGGIFSGYDAFLTIAAGATLIEILTGLIYRGPSAPRDICKELSAILEFKGFSSVREATGIMNIGDTSELLVEAGS